MVEAVFISIAKVILLIVCLWICGKIISVYVANIFMALMLTTFSIFYLLFLTMEGTAQIGYRGINTIIVQSVTLFMTVAMMGISYQVIKLIEVGDSIPGIASLAVILLMLQQVMEGISTMAIAITSGGTLGQSKGDAFMGFGSAFGMVAGGLAMMGLAKLDELKEGNTEESENELSSKESNTKEKNRSSKYSDKEIMAKANRNVENEASGRYSGSSSNSSNTSDNGLGVRYKKGRGVPKNFKKAEDSFRDYKEMKKKSNLGINSKIGIGVAVFFQAATMDLSNLKNITELADKTKSSLKNNNYPYNVMSSTEQLRRAGYALFRTGFKNVFNELTAPPILNAETGSMNEATKGNAYYGDGSGTNKNRNDYYSDIPSNKKNNIVNTPLLSTNSIETYMNNLENLNRNNPNRIVEQQYNSFEDIGNIIKNFRKKMQ